MTKRKSWLVIGLSMAGAIVLGTVTVFGAWVALVTVLHWVGSL